MICCIAVDDPALKVSTPKDKRKKKKKRGKKGRHGESSEEEVAAPRPMVDTTQGELPEGAVASDEERKTKKGAIKVTKDKRFTALDQNLDT